MTIQDQYTSTVRQTQETWADAVESFTNDLQKAFGQPVTPLGFVDPNAAIDQVFDFWEKTLVVQRDFAKKLAGVGVTIGETLKAQAESVRAQAESVGEAVREQVESAKDAVFEAAGKYEDLTKVELQDILARRDLPKTGNVDELRERLVADDQK